MLKPISADESTAGDHQSCVVTLPAGTPRRTRPGTLSSADLSLRRMRYFVDLLVEGHRSALQPDPLTRSLRAERIALGIDVPELDAVPLWSCRRADGSISIPFIDFIVGQIARCADAFFTTLSSASPDQVMILRAHRQALQALREEIDPGRTGPALPPELTDAYLQPAVLDRLCGPLGLLKRLQQECEALLAVGPGDALQG